MKSQRITDLKNHFYTELTENTLPFWIDRCVDREYGGIFTTVDRNGGVLSSHKNMWLQTRFIWLLSRLYSELEKKEEWLSLASSCVDFVKKYGFNDEGRAYFTVDRTGRPVRLRRYLFSEVFAVMGFAEYYRVTGDRSSLEKALELIDIIDRFQKEPGALEPKYNPQTCPGISHSMSMIQINMLQVMRDAHPEGDYDGTIGRSIENLFEKFVKPEEKALLETVAPDGTIIRDTPEGRCVNPGHSIETAWFLMEEGKRNGDQVLIKKSLSILDWSLERGWDPEYGGIFSFVDLEGKQPVQVEWEMKYWWPHNEAIYAALLAFSITGKSVYEEWFEKVFTWSEEHFPDPEGGEWFGYLRRDGSVATNIKASGWKGPFHLPRQQLNCYLLLKEMEK